MSVDTIVQIILAITTSVLVPGVYCLFRAINRNTEEVIELKTCLKKGVEPRIDKCEQDIDTLYDRTNEHGKALAALEAKQRHDR